MMVDRRGSRFAFEVLFLVALAVGLTLAEVRTAVIVGVMALGWVIVAALEWAAWRSQPHFGSGLPPRYYVPRVNLPPAQPLEQVNVGYPAAHRDEAPTWIASAALRAEVLGEWPAAGPEARPEPEPEPTAAPVLEPVADAGPQPVPVRLPDLPVEAKPVVSPPVRRVNDGPLARYTLDPLGEPPPKRRFARRRDEELGTVEVPARPAGPRRLPGQSTRP
jgi:hypothetical protein